MERDPLSVVRSCFNSPLFRGVVLLTSIIVASAAHAEIYKWTDKDGGVHFSERPPAGSKYEVVNPHYREPQTPPESQQPSGEANGGSSNDQKSADQQKLQQQQEQQRKAENEKILQQNCLTAKSRLEKLQSAARIKLKKPDGTVVQLTEEERQAQVDEAQAAIKEYCK